MTEDTRLYTSFQYQEFVDDQENYRLSTEGNKVFAKATKSGLSRDINNKGPKHFKYYIKCYANKKPFDPFPKYSVSDNKNSFIDKVCRAETSYREVNQSIFDKYLNFLKTENNQWLNQCQRELDNL
jgi:hypothetical protein